MQQLELDDPLLTCKLTVTELFNPTDVLADATGTVVRFVQDFCLDQITFFPSKTFLLILCRNCGTVHVSIYWSFVS